MSEEIGTFSQSEMEELKKVFFAQAHEIVADLQDSLLRFEADPGDAEMLKTIKRYVHTLKGDANSVGLSSVGSLCHRMEDVLSSLADGTGDMGHQAVDLLMNSTDHMQKLLTDDEAGRSRADANMEMLEKIDAFFSHAPAQAAVSGIHHSEYQNLEIEDAISHGLPVYDLEVVFHPGCRERDIAALMIEQKLNAIGTIINAVPGMNSPVRDGADRMSLVLASSRGIEEIREAAVITGIAQDARITPAITQGKNREAHAPSADTGRVRPELKSDLLRIEASRVDKIMNLVGELIIGRSMIDQVSKDIEAGASGGDVQTRLAAINAAFERALTDLQNGVMKMRMVPVNHVFRKFPKIVRDLSLEKGKKIRLEVLGREAELDKSIVDSLGEPLMHIIRNMIDHGIEDPATRGASGKPEEGVITLRAYHEAAHIVIEASDDGRGIDRDKLRNKAVEQGFLPAAEAARLSDQETLELIFLSGLSTADRVSETSGRGVGMDAVKTAVQSIKGAVEVSSAPGRGTTFRLTLPLTLAVIKALLFEVNKKLFAIPVPAIAEVLRVMPDDLRTVDGKATLLLRDQVVSMIRLRDVFGSGGNNAGKQFALLIGGGARKVGLLVDRLAGQQELVIKAVDDRHVQSDLVTGASILGDGRVVLILDSGALFRKAVRMEKERLAEARP